ncbi:MAG: AtpZ/AtpI family protein [Bacteroidetes bacterium]|nr:AtpZ/AtpI family protein [Bacteroidota bacterium]
MEETTSPEEKKEKDRPENSLRTYGRYSGMAVQMAVIILVSVWGGMKIDELANMEKPVFTALLSLAGVVAAIYTSIKDLIK